MNKINDKPEEVNCLHLDTGEFLDARRLCTDCKRWYRCTVGDVLGQLRVPTDVDGELDMGFIALTYSASAALYYCTSCREEFRDWDAVIDHIQRGTA